jgi:uncharacterized protein involved in outer membrane biogenesis
MASIVPRPQGRNTNMDSALASTRLDWPRTLRNGFVAALVAIALFALVGFLIVPVVAKGKFEALATRELGRTTTLRRLEFNPFTLHARLFDLVLADREPQRTLLRFDTLDLDLSLQSLWKRAPVFDSVRLARPQVELVRNADGRYNIDDLVERIGSRPEGPPAHFSINNIEVDDGSVSLDDRPHDRKVVVSKIGIGIPFLSSFPYDAQIHVMPRFEGAVDGAPFALIGNSTSPFEDTKEATLELNLDALELPRYAEYAPLPGGIAVRDGALTTRLRLVFATDKDVTRSVALSGTARIDKLQVTRAGGSPLASAAVIDVALARLDALARSVAVDRIAVDAPNVDVRRDADGTPELARILGGAPRAGGPPASSDPGWSFSVAEAHVGNGSVRVTDNAVSPAFATVLSNVGIDASHIASKGAPGTVALRFETDEGAKLTAQAQADIAQGAARGHFELAKIRVGTLRAYYAPAVGAEFRKGTLDFASDFELTREGDATRMTFGNGTAAVSDVASMLRGEREPALRLARAELTGIALDSTKRTFTIDSVAGSQGSLRVIRDRAGAINIEQFTRPSKALETAEGRMSADNSPGQAWNVAVRAVKFEGIGVDVEDRVPEAPVRLRLSDVRLTAQGVTNATGATMSFDAAARTRPAGRMALKGTVIAEPLKVDGRIDASGIDLVPLRPYYEAATNVIVTGGAVATKGRLTYAAARGGSGRARYTGDVTISNFGSLDRPTSQDLVRWKTLTLTGVDAATEPFSLALGAVTADGFFARIILHADATLNLQQLLAPRAAAQAAAPVPPTSAGGVATTTLPDKPASALPVSIGRIQLSDGEVQYADFFVQPNYTAHLTNVAGTVSALSQAQAGTVDIAANVEGTAPVAISGTVNPFAPQLALDLTGKATDIDLPPLTPYAVKYAGYGIQKGKLSLEVHYRVDDRKLAATNKLRLDQLTFGEHVDNPTATKLPVLLAVSLLKDRNGVINLDLPIQGTLDDPKFSVWGVLVQIFVNLITKAITAPFALLGSLAGAGGEQLAYIEFAPGHADLSAAAHAKLATLAKALNERPGLKIDATGRAIPDADREGLKHAMLDQALRAEKLKSGAADGASTNAGETTPIDAAEYPKLLANVYKATDLPDKPRNVLGIAKTIPPAEMETLLLASYRVDDAALTTLANRRAQAVKAWFAGEGGIPAERVFIVAPKLNGDGIEGPGAKTRVDFAIR